MKIRAINNYCVLEMIKPSSEIKKGLIVIPGSDTGMPRWGTVTSVGEGVPDLGGRFYPPDVSVGDIVYSTAHGQYDVYKNKNAESENISVASVLDLLAILKDKDSMEIQPLGSFIEVEKIEITDKNEAGIELPEIRKAPTNQGIVKKVGLGWRGPDGEKVPFQVKEGDKILYNPLRTMVVDFSPLGVDSKKFLIMHGDILAVIDEDE